MSNGGVDLDLYPKKAGSFGDGTKRSYDEEKFKPYVRYQYNAESSAFKLKNLMYNEHKLKGFTDVTQISKLYAYFKDNGKVLLSIQITKVDNINYYYTTTNTENSTKENATFDKFIFNDKDKKDVKELTPEQTISLLQNIEVNTRFEYNDLDTGLKGFLWRGSDIYFDLKKSPNEDLTKTYKSGVTDKTVEVKECKKIGNNFLEFNHIPKEATDSAFHIKGFCDAGGNVVIVQGSFPDELLSSFNVYYKIDDYINPLLIISTLKNISDNDPSFIGGSYLLSKENGYNWNALRTSTSDFSDEEIGNILKSISSNDNKLYINKVDDSGGLKKRLTDITQDLTINLTGVFQENGAYTSGGKNIPYKKVVTTSGYTVVSHASTFISFTISGIATGHGYISQDLIPIGTRLFKLKVFHNGTISTDSPLLIYFLQNDGTNKWLKRYLGDTHWERHHNGPPKRDSDYLDIQKLLEQLLTPKVTIDLAKPVGSYNPTGNSLIFKVASEHNPPGSNFWNFTHRWSDNKVFTVKSLYHDQIPLNGISFPEGPLYNNNKLPTPYVPDCYMCVISSYTLVDTTVSCRFGE